MDRSKSTSQLLSRLKDEKINTWFDLGLFIDRFREENELTERGVSISMDEFNSMIGKGGVGFLTFHYMVDGVTVEIGKYAQLIEKNFPGTPIHYITGKFVNKSETLIKANYFKKEIKELSGFNDWRLYEKFFHTKLERGSEDYNQLILDLWNDTLRIIKKLGSYIEQNDLALLYIVNICSNPGNVSAALALVLLSEFMGIPVINNNHDFYFEGGNSKFDRVSKKLKKGPRDFFYKNAHLGEVFSVIEMLYPWESNYWINVNINNNQSRYLVKNKGHNPARVMEIGTAVDTDIYTNIDKRRNINAFIQFEKILARYKKQLISYSVEDVERLGLVSEHNPKPILIGNKTAAVDKFISENIIFLQPTRIISRKRIELGFNLLLRMFENPDMNTRLLKTPHLKITLMISGPIAVGHYDYYKKLIGRFNHLLSKAPEYYRNRIYLALLLGELDKSQFRKSFDRPIGIPELYNISSLILLPSKTEGRGLPIIEATACGTPIFCRRYDPEEVYSEVIGEHLNEDCRLIVYEFQGKKIGKSLTKKIIDRVFFPHNYTEFTKHNRKVVEKRYSLNSLNINMQHIFARLYNQLQVIPGQRAIAENILKSYKKLNEFTNEDLEYLIHKDHRQYLAGYGKLKFMLMLKSLIDPSFFRQEQQQVKGMVFFFAQGIIKRIEDEGVKEEKILEFYNAVYQLFHVVDGEVEIRHDHSMSYRHRNNYNYLYQDYTFQELTGIVNLLYLNLIGTTPHRKVEISPQFFTDWNLALLQLTASNYLAIDDRKMLIKKLKSNLSFAYFPGEYIMYELEFFALQALRSRLRLKIEEVVTEEILRQKVGDIAPVYIFAQDKKLGGQKNKQEIILYIQEGGSRELKLLFDFQLIRVISTQQTCVGIHFAQLGEDALRVLREIRERGGFLLTNRRHAALMTDIVNIDRFHIGRVRADFAANIMGIPIGSGYIQYVPAGLRTTLAYPTPVQTAKDFDDAIKSKTYLEAIQKKGEKEVLERLVYDAEHRGSPIMHVLKDIISEGSIHQQVDFKHISGIYADGNPYSGVIAKLNLFGESWDFNVVSTKEKPKTVSKFVEDFEMKYGRKAEIAWNGGYILNPELVGKLGLPESYIGSPLGLLISEGKCICPPLFNKAALLFYNDGRADIKRVTCSEGIVLSAGEHTIKMGAHQYNVLDPGEEPAYYDLLHKEKSIKGNGRIIVRLSGNIIKEIIHTGPNEDILMVPVGLTLSFPESSFAAEFRKDQQINISIPGMENVVHAVEAGPMLVDDFKDAIDMETEGWKTSNSIATQAARLDYTDMRGPKIAIGMNDVGELAVLTINGRIRESVGATHGDMSGILIQQGMKKGMGFDPGGSSTLVINGKTLNISPYNHQYEYNIYALSPEPRAVSNAVIGYIKE